MRYVFFLAICMAAAAVLYTAITWSTDDQAVFLLKPGDERIVAQGKQIYAESCASCHGANLEGQPNWKTPGANGRLPAPPHDATGHTWHHTDEVLFGLTKFGAAKFAGLENYETDMPIYEDVLSDEEIVAVLSYIKAQWPQDIRQRHDQMNRQRVN
ncbi:cytochrome c [Nitratireductor sp. XY-223]|uniref:c-type cytochrome n=1 Tax=Nitratireductor sp. XY-223 TaxID=2561926 RepID=UPI0010AB2171|nr:cytochrome c [Nitratireductor sp. XY-223]